MSVLQTKPGSRRKRRQAATRHRRRPAGERFAKDFPFGEGEVIEIKLRGSRNGINWRQRATLDSLGLRKRGQTRTITFHKPTTSGMLHAVAHLVAVRSLSAVATAPARTRRARLKQRTPTVEDSAVSVKTYKSGGGKSRLVLVEQAGQLRIEAQRKSFALMWPSNLGLHDFFDAVSAIWWSEDGQASLVSSEADEVKELSTAELVKHLGDNGFSFVRADFSDRALTWARQYRDPDRSGLGIDPAVEDAHEVSLSSNRFDPDYAAALIARTAVAPIADRTDQMIAKAKQTLRAYM